MGLLYDIQHFLSVTACDVTDVLTGSNIQWGVCDRHQQDLAETYDPCHEVYGVPCDAEGKPIEAEGLWGLQNEITLAGAILVGALAYRWVK